MVQARLDRAPSQSLSFASEESIHSESGIISELFVEGGGAGLARPLPTEEAASESARKPVADEDASEEATAYDERKERGKSCLAASLVFVALYVALHLAIGARQEVAECDDEALAAAVGSVCKACSGGMSFLPLAGEAEQTWNNTFRVILYIVAMVWCFVGVGLVCDQFMNGIEEITSTTHLVWRTDEDGVRTQVPVKVWNATIANLSLMALGSSAPEILLAVIETVTGDFYAGSLGPSCIVGSAAFNLFIIIAVCIVAIPEGESRKIDDLHVFSVTCSTSLFAYLWILFILLGSTPHKVDIWEASLTLAFFPILLLTAWLADKGYCRKRQHTDRSLSADGSAVDTSTCDVEKAQLANAAVPANELGEVHSTTLMDSSGRPPLKRSDSHGTDGTAGQSADSNDPARPKLSSLGGLRHPHTSMTHEDADTMDPQRSAASQYGHEAMAAWLAQFGEALYVNGTPEDQSSANAKDWCAHFISLPWKVLAACVPPPAIGNGSVCFAVALCFIGLLTFLVGELAALLGCCIGIPNEICAITLVALGTSLPDTFASRISAVQEENADASIGNVTGSNAVNVFLGLGLPWTVASIYWHAEGPTHDWKKRVYLKRTYQDRFMGDYPDGGFIVPAGSLGWSVCVFTIGALFCVGLLIYRRRVYGAELGGPGPNMAHAGILVVIWALYIAISIVIFLQGEKV